MFKKRAKMDEARREVVFWVALPTGVVVALLALLGALQSPSVLNTLHFSFDTHHQAFINHSLWWVICTNITGAFLTTAVVAWLVSLYFVYQSIRHLLSFTRSKRAKDRKEHHLLWSASALVAIPVILIIMWYAVGAVLQHATAPSSSTLPLTSTANISGAYWTVTAPVFESLILLIPILIVIAAYLLVKRHRM